MPVTYRTAALRYRCPQCKARKGDPCLGVNGERESALHQARHDKAIRCGAPVVVPPALRKLSEAPGSITPAVDPPS